MRVIGTMSGGHIIAGYQYNTSVSQFIALSKYQPSEAHSDMSCSGSNDVGYFIAKCNGANSQKYPNRPNAVDFVNEKPSWIRLQEAAIWDNIVDFQWAEMEDGSLVGTTPVSAHSTNYPDYNPTYFYLAKVNSGVVTKSPRSELLIGGKKYTVTPVDFGYETPEGDKSRVLNSEFYRYVLGSRDSKELGGLEWPWKDLHSGSNMQGAAQPLQTQRVLDNPGIKLPVFPDFKNDNRYTAVANTGSAKSPVYGYKGDGDSSVRVHIFFIARPEALKPWARIEADYGTRSVGFDLATPVYESGDTVSWTVKSGGRTVASASNVSKTRPIALTSDELQSLGAGKKTLEVTIVSESGSNKYSTTINVIPHSIAVEGKPHKTERRASGCALANAVVVGEGGVNKWWVSNNAADEEPAWEAYEGDSHVFSNKSKTADKWAIGWKCQIGGPGSKSRSELIRQVAMGVIYE